ncbi:MATE family efflux transporter [Alteromonas sp. a30]|uniref:MATE family efflux transporter n=1 Tax=Alteromonas sp. a30 TaxID=2730917 RepID=UPI0022809232|nr:MATE family efflux transporter [Alteromonas sp. a30]MCY7296734.1 MATE family efflux transporter [Alteromonas sp. a30]
MTKQTLNNPYLTQPIAGVFLKTALPIIIMMVVSGSLNLVDAYFIGVFVGPQALASVTAMFPLFMMMVALSSWAAAGFASVMARLIGAQKHEEARQAYRQAITLVFVISSLLMTMFTLVGSSLTLAANAGNTALAQMSNDYISIIIYSSPLFFVLAICSDSLRSEGKAGFMALVSLSTTVLNGLLNYVFIVWLNWGVAGSAWGTVMAQFIALVIVWLYRKTRHNSIDLPIFALTWERNRWREFLSLGAPSSLTYIGVALSSAAIIFSIQQWQLENYSVTMSAYGVITRIMTFIFLPLMGLGLAMQSIVGNNVGAGLYQRSNSCICIAISLALGYGVLLEAFLWLLNDQIGQVFVSDPLVVNEIARLLPIMSLALFLLGPLLMVNFYFQSIGDAKRAGILSVAKTYLFALPLILTLPLYFGEWGIWYAAPLAEFLGLILTLTLLYLRAEKGRYPFGLLYNVDFESKANG